MLVESLNSHSTSVALIASKALLSTLENNWSNVKPHYTRLGNGILCIQN